MENIWMVDVEFFLINECQQDPKLLSLAKYADRWFLKIGFIYHSILFPNHPCIYATRKGEIIGFILYEEMSDHIILEMIYTKKKFRKLGIMTKLIERIPTNNKRFNWWVHHKNLTAINAYLKMGATIHGVHGADMYKCSYKGK